MLHLVLMVVSLVVPLRENMQPPEKLRRRGPPEKLRRRGQSEKLRMRGGGEGQACEIIQVYSGI